MQNKKTTKPNGVTFGMISVVIMSVSIVLILTLVKVYLSNQIYHESKSVNKMVRETEVLKAEKAMLEESVEALRYKYNVTNTIFVIEEEGY